jgi:O-antigen/teichoic acid export membrane protein
MKLLQSVGMNLLGIGVSSFLGLLMLTLLGRWLSPEEFGLYTYLQQLVNLALVATTMGSAFILSHYYGARYSLPHEVIFRVTFWSVVLFSAMASVLLLALAGFIAPVGSPPATLRWGTMILLPFAMKNFYAEALRAEGRFGQRALTESIGASLRLATVLALAYLGAMTVKNVFLLLPFAFLAQAVMSAAFVDVWTLSLPERDSLREVYQLTRRKTGAYIVASLLNLTIPALIFMYLGRILGAEVLGRFAYLYFFTFVLARIGEAFTITLLPLSGQEGDLTRLSTALWKANFAVGYMVLTVSVGCVLFGGAALKMLFDYQLGGLEPLTLALLLTAFSIKMVAGNIMIVLSGMGKVREVLYIGIVTACFNAAMGYLSIWRFGMLGAAAAFLAVYLIQFGLLIWRSRKGGLTFEGFAPWTLAVIVSRRYRA